MRVVKELVSYAKRHPVKVMVLSGVCLGLAALKLKGLMKKEVENSVPKPLFGVENGERIAILPVGLRMNLDRDGDGDLQMVSVYENPKTNELLLTPIVNK